MDPEFRIRKRIPKACRRCHRRKQKCDQKVPTCSNCESANQLCSRAESAPSWHHGMSKGALADRIEILEARLAATLGRDVSCISECSQQPSALGALASDRRSTHGRRSDGLLRFLTVGNEIPGESVYLGPSSGLAIADAVGTRLLPVNSNQQPELTLQENGHPMASAPNDTDGSRILEAYFTHMHTRLPFIDRAKIMELHAQRYRPLATPNDEFERFKLFMVYAIGAAILQSTGAYEAVTPGRFLLTAMNFDPTLRESISIAAVEAMMLLVVYNLRSSSHSSVWYMIGLAMRTCIDLGLHREVRYRKFRPYEAEIQKRLFWSVYLIERYTAWSLGRPFSIAEEEVDTEPPLSINDSITDDEVISRCLRTRHDAGATQDKSTMGRFVASVRLQRILSQIHTRIYRVDQKISSLFPEIVPLMSTLHNFKETLPSLDIDDADFVRMHWNNAVRMLIQPFLSILDPRDELISTCITSSGEVCQLFKRLRQREFSGYSFLLVNSVFMAGLTICFCLFRSPTLWSPTVSNDLRACSSSLFVMAERNSRLKKHRDALEAIINKVMDHVQQADETSKSNTTVIGEKDISEYQPSFHACEQPSIGSSEQSHFLGAQMNSSMTEFDSYMTGLLSELEGFPSYLQPGQFSASSDGTQPLLHGIFMEDLWAAETFHQPADTSTSSMPDEFSWRV